MFTMPLCHKAVRLAFFAATFFLFALPQAGAGSLSDLSGLWVLDAPKTEALWKAEKKSYDQESLDMVNAFYRMDIDFKSLSLIEGTVIVIGGEPTRTPFTAKEDGQNVRLSFTDRDGEQTRTWRLMPDGTVEQRSTSADALPLVLMRETMLEYSGLWAVSDVNKVLEGFRKLGMPADEEPEIRKVLAALRLRVDFNQKTLAWEDTKGEHVPGNPRGDFSITSRQKQGCTLDFDGMEAQWIFVDANNAVFEAQELTIPIKRVSPK